ncbi:glycosyltransferase [Symbiopectobacterium purcellii]|uniref:glycosyltransferase n=1 Tax=Symbiopectobacterium purcellii TaxID=2871826 RepID=UPI003F8339CC
MNIIFQPYYHWLGHFKQYSDYLSDNADNILKPTRLNKPSVFFDFILLRFFLCAGLFVKLIFFVPKNKVKEIIFLDVDPVSSLFFLSMFHFNKTKLIFTIHAIQTSCYDSGIKQAIANTQRMIFNFFLRMMSKRKNAFFVVHSDLHKKQLGEIIKENIFKIYVIEYPAPLPKVADLDDVRIMEKQRIDLLVFGAMRVDKGIFNFLTELCSLKIENIKITFAGKVYDKRIDSIKSKLPENILIIDNFIEQSMLDGIIADSDYILVPYSLNYKGGAGPLKDATAYGKPVLASNLPLFIEIADKYGFVKIFSNLKQLVPLVNSISSSEYRDLARNSLNFSRGNNWSKIRKSYSEVGASFDEFLKKT